MTKSIFSKSIIYGIAGIVVVFSLLYGKHSFSYGESAGQYKVCNYYKIKTSKKYTHTYRLKGERVIAKRNNKTIWKSPSTWRVKQILYDDVDSNGTGELMMVLYKKGSFGNSLPFWIDENDQNISCHLFVYKWRGKNFTPMWGSSATPHPIKHISTKKSKDGKCRIFITEELTEKNSEGIISKKHETNEWFWDSWGFTKK